MRNSTMSRFDLDTTDTGIYGSLNSHHSQKECEYRSSRRSPHYSQSGASSVP